MRAVICDRCGCDNPNHLVFCQDCGRRLQPQQRVVAPTPPAGVPARGADAHLGAAAAMAGVAVAAAANSGTGDIPMAPNATTDEVICQRCQTRNPATGRFCVSCGMRMDVELSASGADARATSAASSLDPVRAMGAVHLDHGREPLAALTLACHRCQGVCEAGMRFCKFCGAPLAAAPAPTDSASPDAALVQQAAERAADGLRGRGPAPEPVPASSRLLPQRPAVRPDSFAGPMHPLDARGEPTGKYQPLSAGAVEPSGQLVVVGGDGREGPRFALVGDQLDIGREEGAVTLADDRYMSPRHARIVRIGNRWHVRNLESTNGVYVRIREEHELSHGDLLLLGVEVLRFEVVMDAELSLGPAVQHGTLVFGSPALPRPARLVQRTVEGVARDVYHLHRVETTIGREAGDIVFTDDPYMSRRHAMIRRSATGAFTLRDLGSSNGTFIAIRNDWPLQNGDSLRVGQHLFRVELLPT